MREVTKNVVDWQTIDLSHFNANHGKMPSQTNYTAIFENIFFEIYPIFFIVVSNTVKWMLFIQFFI